MAGTAFKTPFPLPDDIPDKPQKQIYTDFQEVEKFLGPLGTPAPTGGFLRDMKTGRYFMESAMTVDGNVVFNGSATLNGSTIFNGGQTFNGILNMANILALNDNYLSLRTSGDSNRLFYDTNNDIATLQGFNNAQLKTSVGPHTFVLKNDGTGNLGGALSVANDVFVSPNAVYDGNGKVSGNWGGVGGALNARGGGNTISFAWTGSFQMWVDVTNVKTFVIDHPTDADKRLIHACLEGPESAVFYRGAARLERGWVEVRLPDYFEALCAEEGRSVQLTCIADDPVDEWCPVLHATYPKNGRFFVGLGSGVVVHDQRFWWEVKAVRKDVGALLVEPQRDAVEVLGEGPYTYYRER